VINWLRDLSDGFIKFDEDLMKKLPVQLSSRKPTGKKDKKSADVISAKQKPFFIGKTEQV
jgi:hypothetical protein